MRKEEGIVERKSKKAQVVRQSYNDLCMTCNSIAICTTRKNKQQPTWFCEEFDDYVTVSEQELPATAFQPVQPPARVRTIGNTSIQAKGLCENCESFAVCQYVKPDGGVWHCEEYC
jgi:hypothetical protein